LFRKQYILRLLGILMQHLQIHSYRLLQELKTIFDIHFKKQM